LRATWVLVGVASVVAACSGGNPAAEQAAGFPPQPEGVSFPTESWPEGEWPSGVDRAAVDEAVDVAFADGGAERVRAVVVVHGGELVYERYSPNEADGPAKVLPGWSLAKSFTSALVGVLVKDGRLEVDSPAPVSAWSAEGDPRGEITLDDLLRMSSGLAWDERPYPEVSDLSQMLAADDVAAFVAGKKLAHEPGTTFAYNTGATMLVDRVLADEVGAGRDFRDFMNAELLDRIGIRGVRTEFDAAGTWLGGAFLETTARNFAKLGLLYVRDGVWDGERILPEGWVDYSRTPSPANPEYGAGWWVDRERPGTFYALGRAGQVIAVAPEHDLTFVLLSTSGEASLPLSEAIIDAFAARK
jgi:CubicO group peptidase (beta-lactamase class C family)